MTDQGNRPGGAGDSSDQADDVALAKEVCLRALTMRARSRHELMTLLARKGYDVDVAEQAVARLEGVGLIDDAQFARDWVEQRHRHQQRSARALRHELRNKGIDEELIQETVGEIGDDEQYEAAVILIEKKLRSLQQHPPDVVARRVLGMLARRGYSADVASRALRACLEGPVDTEV